MPRVQKVKANLAKQTVLSMTPNDFKRIGAGKANQIGQIFAGLTAADLTDSVYWYDYDDHSLPLTTTEFNRLFNGERTVLGCNDREADDDCSSRRTNIDCGSDFQCPFLLTGLCIVGVANPALFSVRGVFNPTQPAANSEIPRVSPLEQSDSALHGGGNCGLVPNIGAITPAGNWGHASLMWGYPAQIGLSEFMQTTRFDLKICNKLLVVSELLSTLGMCLINPTFQGAGEACIATGPFIRCVNDVMEDKNLGVFITVNTTEADTNICYPQPLVDFMFGSISFPGVSGKPYMLDQALFLGPTMGSQFSFINTVDEDCICPLQTLLTVTTQAPHSNFLADVASITGSCGNDTTIPGGQFSIGVLLYGFEMTPTAVAAWLSQMVIAKSPQLSGIIEMHQQAEGRQYLREALEQGFARELPHMDRVKGYLNGLPNR